MLAERTKLCRGCGQTKPLSDFYRHPQTRLGVQTYCKQCHRQAGRLRWHGDTFSPRLPPPVLTVRQTEALKLRAEGLTVAEIAAAMGTIRQVVSELSAAARDNLGAHTICQAVYLATQRGLI